jgi:uncharacterized membrane protein
MRSLSLIFGIASVPLVYIIANKLTSKLNALLLASIIAVAPLLVFFSVEVRMYSIVVFLVLLSLNYLIDFEQKNDKKAYTLHQFTDSNGISCKNSTKSGGLSR